ncbi:MAG: exopolysaccharide biosynthesis polyprenyl glycosylphosphotransferase [Fusobacteriaceae bacterium]
MEYRKDSNLKVIYVFLIGTIFMLCNYLLPIGQEMYFSGLLTFVFIVLGLYISGNMKFYILKYSFSQIVSAITINSIFFFLWFIYSWDLLIFIFFLIFVIGQILVRWIMLRLTFKTGYLTVLGNGKMKENVEKSLGYLEGYKYIEYVLSEDQNPLDFLKMNKISLTILAQNVFSEKEISTLFKIRISGVEVKNYSNYMEEIEGKIDVDSIDENWILNAYGFKLLYSQFEIQTKRAIDIILAIIITAITFPIMILAAIIVRIESPGPAIYSQARVGKNSVEFYIHKFRSMRNDAEKDGAKWASVNDPRVTKFGNFMRKTRIDELPQLWNVIKGEMSFIGPRPERMVFIKDLEKKIPYYNLRHLVKPGLTGWAQVMYPYGASVEDAKNKLEYDLYYVKNQNFHMDLVIMFRTLKTVIFGKGR